MTQIFKLNGLPLRDHLHIIKVLKEGACAVLPTDTVYGVTVCASCSAALDKLNKIKNNPADKPAQVLCTIKQAFELAQADAKFTAVAQKFWPGALTLVGRSSTKGAAFLNGSPTIGLRVPDNTFVLGLMEALQSPLLASSANMHTDPVCTNEEEILKVFDGRVDIIVLNGNISTRPSAVIDLSAGGVKVIRSGDLDAAEIEKLVSQYK